LTSQSDKEWEADRPRRVEAIKACTVDFMGREFLYSTAVHRESDYGDDEHTVEKLEDANIVSSAVADSPPMEALDPDGESMVVRSYHRPVLDMDFPMLRTTPMQPIRLDIKKPMMDEDFDFFAVVWQETFGDTVSGLKHQKGDPFVHTLDVMPASPHLHYVISSSTKGHFHWYINKGIKWEAFAYLLRVMQEVGLLQEGFVTMSLRRGFADVRLPWVNKRPFDFTAPGEDPDPVKIGDPASPPLDADKIGVPSKASYGVPIS
jgi:hypothetical protein